MPRSLTFHQCHVCFAAMPASSSVAYELQNTELGSSTETQLQLADGASGVCPVVNMSGARRGASTRLSQVAA